MASVALWHWRTSQRFHGHIACRGDFVRRWAALDGSEELVHLIQFELQGFNLVPIVTHVHSGCQSADLGCVGQHSGLHVLKVLDEPGSTISVLKCDDVLPAKFQFVEKIQWILESGLLSNRLHATMR